MSLPSVKAILYTSKQLSNGEYPLMLRVTYKGKRKYKSLGYSLKRKDWNDNKNEVRASHPQASDINTLIRTELKRANDAVLTLQNSGVDYTCLSVIKAISKSSSVTPTLFALFEERIAFFKDKAQQYNTATGYRTLLNIIKRYTNNKDLDLFEVDSAWLKDFETYLYTKYKDTSIKKHFDCFKAIMNYAVSKKYIQQSQLSGYSFAKKLDMHTRKRALSISEFASLQKYYYDTYGLYGEKTTNLETTKKHYWNKWFLRRGTTKLTPLDAEQFSLILFFSSFYLQGLALVDLAKLQWRDLQVLQLEDSEKFNKDVALHGLEYAQEHKEYTDYYKIEINRTKTNRSVRIVVEQSIMDSFLNPLYPEDGEIDNDGYIFPIFASIDNTAGKRFSRMSYATYLVNHNLQRVGEKVGISGITFYSARHTYASYLYHNNVNIGLIAQNMGRNPDDIETYLKEFDVNQIIEANKKSYLHEQTSYVEAKKNKPINPEKVEFFKKKREEEERLLAEYGGYETINKKIEKEVDELEKTLTELFGDDTSLKIKYLQDRLNKGEK
jgi:integrase